MLGRHVAPGVVADAFTEGAKTLEAFYAKAEKEGFDKIKDGYAYDYFDHATGRRRRMCPGDLGKAPVVTYAVDHVAICTGTNHWASLPRFEGQGAFERERRAASNLAPSRRRVAVTPRSVASGRDDAAAARRGYAAETSRDAAAARDVDVPRRRAKDHQNAVSYRRAGAAAARSSTRRTTRSRRSSGGSAFWW